jgi:2-keto-4-pentenoate hydratase/2-oxohepta-3-ene-1,7-dioic acid hydratase in catechol pathway
MKFLRFKHDSHFHDGLLEGQSIRKIEGSPFGDFQLTDRFDLKAVQLLAPCVPSKIIGIGLNYKDHIREMGHPTPEEPLIFLKANSSLNGPGDPILLPKMSEQVDFEGELAVVMGKKTRHVSETHAKDHIFGYACFNDVTARDLQRKDIQFTRAKSFDTFSCLGPWIETEIDPSRLKIETRVNGETKQSSNTSELLFSVPKLVAFLSQIMTLYPGDVITTGTPSGVGPLKKGDVVEVTVDGIGTLSNPVD